MNIVLGQRYRCIVSGFEGIATGKGEYLNGCVRVLLSPPVDKEGKYLEGEWIDSAQLEVVDTGILEKRGLSASRSGGPQHDAPKRY